MKYLVLALIVCTPIVARGVLIPLDFERTFGITGAPETFPTDLEFSSNWSITFAFEGNLDTVTAEITGTVTSMVLSGDSFLIRYPERSYEYSGSPFEPPQTADNISAELISSFVVTTPSPSYTWDATRTDGQEIITIKGQEDFALSVAFSPNGRYIATGNSNPDSGGNAPGGVVTPWRDPKSDQSMPGEALPVQHRARPALALGEYGK